MPLAEELLCVPLSEVVAERVEEERVTDVVPDRVEEERVAEVEDIVFDAVCEVVAVREADVVSVVVIVC